ncbi:CvpA family protein [Rosettibacter firmus]|uniref:CvpA family protein n=1 Tax=Rosettibacter firmus TaxID=3111522 RepID=UPI00336BB155
MNYVDYLIFIIIAIGFILGFKDGLIRKIIGLIGLILAVFLSFEYSQTLGKYLNPIFNEDEYFSNIFSGILIFLIVILITTILKRIVHPVDKLNKFLNQFLGGLIGIVQIVFFLSGLLIVLDILGFPDDITKKESFTYSHVANIIPKSIDFFIGKQSEASEVIKNFIENKDTIKTPPIDSLIIK